MTFSKKNSVAEISDNALCCGCGMCVGTCPVQAISLKYNVAGFLQVQIDKRKCIECGCCTKICPSVTKNAEELLENYRDKWYLGEAVIGYVGHVTDEGQRFRGQSGGVITGLLAWLREKGEIDGAVVADFSESEQQPQAVFANTADEIRKSSGSYYVQVPILSVLGKNNSIGKTAIVCTGCQSNAVHLAEKKMGVDHPYLIVGVVCEGIYSLELFKELAGDRSDSRKIKEFRFRDKRNGGWPGGVYIGYDDNTFRCLPIKARTQLKPCYASYRCQQCIDMNNLYADIVCGDPWFLQKKIGIESLRKGETVVIARTQKGAKVLQLAAEAGILHLQECHWKEFFEWNSFLEGRVAKNCAVQAVCRENNLPQLYPNIDLKVNVCLKRKLKIPIKRWSNQVLYSWKYYNVSNMSEVFKLVEEKKRSEKKKNIVKWPFLLVLNLLSKCKRLIMRIIVVKK